MAASEKRGGEEFQTVCALVRRDTSKRTDSLKRGEETLKLEPQGIFILGGERREGERGVLPPAPYKKCRVPLWRKKEKKKMGLTGTHSFKEQEEGGRGGT